ncbi:MAG TPA: hypothetical protein DCP71_11860 [Verrucomicrobiales bacterium]|nr:hypothetical protein [Verrucomicrobiales bacterium]
MDMIHDVKREIAAMPSGAQRSLSECQLRGAEQPGRTPGLSAHTRLAPRRWQKGTPMPFAAVQARWLE